MPETVTCPQCSRRLKVPDELVGQPVQCPTCNATFTADASVGVIAGPPPLPDRPYERRDDEPPPRSRREDDDFDRPRRRDDDYDRPRRREDDDYDRPRRRDYDEDDRPPRRRRYADDDYDRYGGRGRQYLSPHRGGSILTTAIVGLFICGIILGPIAFFQANTDLAEMQAGRMDPSGEGMTRAGQVIGIIAFLMHLALIGCTCMGSMAGNQGGGF